MSLEHVLKNSSVADKRPTAAQLANGEISINWNADGAFLCCKDTAGNIQQVGGVKINEAAPADPVKGTVWLKPSTKTLSVYSGTVWESVSGGGGGAGGGVATVAGSAPITSSGGSTPTIAITPATPTAAGSMSAADKTKLNSLANYTLPAATSTTLGGVMVGENLVITAGVLAAQLPGALIYKGGIDLTTTAPAAPAAGHTYVSTKAGTIHSSWTGITGTAAVGDMVLYSGTAWDRVGSSGFGVTSVTGAAPITIAGTAAAPEVGIRAATTTATGAVQLATAAETTTGALNTKAVTPAGLKVELDKKAPLDSPALTGTPTAPTAAAGTNTTQVATTEFVTGVVTALTGSATAPTSPTTGQVWIDSSKIPSVTNVWNGTAWIPQAGATISSATAPTTPATGTVWVNTSVTPNVTQIWDGTAWVTATPDKASAAAIASDAKYATKAEVQAEDLWDRTGTELAPKTAGDNVFTSGAVKVGGTTAAPTTVIQADGKVGIGTNAPERPLDVRGVVQAGNGTIKGALSYSTRVEIGSISNHELGFMVNSVNRAILDANGKLSLGTPSSYGGGLSITAASSTPPLIVNGPTSEFARVTDAGDALIGGTLPASPNITLKADGSATFKDTRIDSSGRLLVGTSSSVTGSTAKFSKIQSIGNSGNTTANAVIAIGRGTAATGISSNNAIGSVFFTDNAAAEFASIECFADATPGASDYPGRLVFSTTADGAAIPTERMRITADGKVGIGTSTPATKLAVDGDIWLGNGAGAEIGRLALATGSTLGLVGSANVNGITLSTVPTGGTASLERFRITPDGNALLGGTLPASPNITLKASGEINIGHNSSIYAVAGRGLLSVNGTGALIDLQTGTTSRFRIFCNGTDTELVNSEAAGVIKFGTNNVERLRITSAGIVNIKNTPVYADNAAAKAAGLVDGDIYRTATGQLMIVFT